MTWEHRQLWQRVCEAIAALPIHFRSDTFIEGINATDIFTLSSALGATIENQVVETLNQLRNVWDRDCHYQTASFIRRPQSFPDVLLWDAVADAPVFGIELKGWYVLSKEGEPSFRFAQTPGACAEADLIVVVPWSLANVISGRPKVFSPYVELARYAAEYRNFHWQYQRETKANATIRSPAGVHPYPPKAMETNDRPAANGGGNFGRFARTGIMDGYLLAIKNYLLCGIKASYWLEFFKVFQEQANEDKVMAAIAKLRNKILGDKQLSGTLPERLQAALRVLADLELMLLDR